MTIKLEHLGKAVLDTQYAVRGPIVARAGELERAVQGGHRAIIPWRRTLPSA